MRECGKSLRVRITEHEKQCDRRKSKRDPIQRVRREQKDPDRDIKKSPCEADGKSACRKIAIRRSRILCNYLAVGNAIERHRRRACPDHCGRDPDKLTPCRQAIRGHDSAKKREGKRKKRVLELDHFERGPEFLKKSRQSERF